MLLVQPVVNHFRILFYKGSAAVFRSYRDHSSVMKKNIFKIIFSILFLTLIFGYSNNVLALDPDNDTGLVTAARKGYGVAADGHLTDKGIMVKLPSIIGSVLGAVLSLLGVVFMVLIIYGGFTWMFARGNDQAVTKAKGIIETAIIGLVIVISAYGITTFIAENLATK